MRPVELHPASFIGMWAGLFLVSMLALVNCKSAVVRYDEAKGLQAEVDRLGALQESLGDGEHYVLYREEYAMGFDTSRWTGPVGRDVALSSALTMERTVVVCRGMWVVRDPPVQTRTAVPLWEGDR